MIELTLFRIKLIIPLCFLAFLSFGQEKEFPCSPAGVMPPVPCPCSVNAGPDKRLCAPGGIVKLNGSASGNPYPVSWEFSPYLDHPNLLTPNASNSETTTYTLVGQCLHPTNLIVNPAFSLTPFVGFTAEYVYDTFPGTFAPGHITITPTPSLFDPTYIDCADHSPGSDNNMLVVDGSMHPGESFWCEKIALEADTCYQLEIYITALSTVNLPHLTFTIDGALYGALEPTANLCTWDLFPLIFKAPGGVATICLQDAIDEADGNDFAVDDISLRKICKMMDQVTVYVDTAKTVDLKEEICEGDKIKFGNLFLSDSGTYVQNLKTWHKCDSIVTLDLNVVKVQASVVPNTQILNCNTFSVLLEGFGSSEGPEYEYYWTTTNGKIDTDPNNITIQVSKPGKYDLKVTYNSGKLKCEKTTSIIVNADYSVPNISAGPDGKLSCKDSVLFLDGKVFAPSNNFSIKWDTDIGYFNSSTDLLNPEISGPGTYTLTVTNETSGCTATDKVVITQDPGIPKAKVSGDVLLNCNIDSVLLDSKGSDTGPGISQKWTTTGGAFLSSPDSAKVYVNKAGTYFYTVTDKVKGCKAIASIVVKEDKVKPVIDAGLNDTLSCLQQQTTLNGTNNISAANSELLWTTNTGTIISGAQTLTPTIKSSGTYYLTVKNTLNGCSSVDSVSILKDANFPNAVAGADDTISCIKKIIDLNSNGSSQGSNITYLWTAITGSITGLNNTPATTTDQAGKYLLTVTNKLNGCIETDTVNVLLNQSPPNADIATPDLLTCKDLTVEVNASNSSSGSGYTYSWSTPNGNIVSGNSSIIARVDEPGQYNILITNKSNGCISKDSILVNQDIQNPDIGINGPVELSCKKTTDKLSIVNNKPNQNVSYKWNTGDGKIDSGGNTSTPTISKAGTYTLITTNEDNGCTDEDLITVVFNGELPIAKAGQDTFINCCSSSINLSGSFKHSNNNVNYSWSTLNGTILNGQTTLNPKIGSTGTYIITITDPLTGCIGIDSILVTEDKIAPSSTLLNPGKLTCKDTKLTINLTNTNPAWTYKWETSAGNIQGNTTGTSVDITETGYYKVTIYNQINCCGFEDSIPISEDKEAPIIDAGPTKVLTCKDSIAVLDGKISNANGQETKQWHTFQGAILSGAQGFNPVVNSEGFYYLTVTNKSNGCKSIDSVYISRNKNYPTDIIADLNEPGCHETGSIEILSIEGGSGPYQYSINGSPYQTGKDFKSLVPGNYSIGVIDDNGCKTHIQLTVPEPHPIEVTLPAEITVNWEDSTQLVPVLKGIDEDDIAEVHWVPGKWLSCDTCFSPYITKANNTELYTVNITDKNGCTAQGSIRIFITKVFNIYIPNGFSPNEDQINDKWFIFADPNKVRKLHTIQVFDRWGELMWEANDVTPSLFPDIGWDGIFRGQTLNPGVFVYWTLVEFADGKKKIYKGDITLVR